MSKTVIIISISGLCFFTILFLGALEATAKVARAKRSIFKSDLVNRDPDRDLSPDRNWKVIDGRRARQEEDQDEESDVAKAPVKKGGGNNKTAPVVEELSPVTIGNFQPFVHAIASSDVIILDEKTIEIPDFSYDGEGPASWFVVGQDGEYTREMVDLGEYTVLPDENEGCSSLRRYNQETIKLTLPGKLKVSDISYLSVYCLRFNHNFGYVVIPDDIKAPKAGKDTSKVDECENVESSESTGGNNAGSNNRPPPRRPPPPANTNSGGLIGGILNLLG